MPTRGTSSVSAIASSSGTSRRLKDTRGPLPSIRGTPRRSSTSASSTSPSTTCRGHTEALEYLGELYLALDDLPRAEEQLAKLGEICRSGCEEHEELKEAIVRYKAARGG